MSSLKLFSAAMTPPVAYCGERQNVCVRREAGD